MPLISNQIHPRDFIPQGEKRWVVSDIIGAEDGLGVENLSGSGAIAASYWWGPLGGGAPRAGT